MYSMKFILEFACDMKVNVHNDSLLWITVLENVVCAYLGLLIHSYLFLLTFKDIDKMFIYHTALLMLLLRLHIYCLYYAAEQKFHEFYIKEFVSFNATGW